MHDQMKRLTEFAQNTLGIAKPSDLARALNVSPQALNNWKTRGISKPELFAIQTKIGVSAEWLQSGNGEPINEKKQVDRVVNKGMVSVSQLTELMTLFAACDEQGRSFILNAARSTFDVCTRHSAADQLQKRS